MRNPSCTDRIHGVGAAYPCRVGGILHFIRGARLVAVLSVCLLGCATVDCCATGMSYISDMSVPAPRNRVIGDWGYSLDISRPRKLIGGAGCRFVAPGVAMYPDTHGEYLWEVFASVDLASFGRATWAELADTPGIFPILSPLIGAWFWVESPDNAGFLLGVKAGLGARLRGPPRAPAVTVQYGYMGLFGVLDDESAEMQTVTFAVHWPL